MPKYIFITGGVVSSLGKGIAAASIGKLLQARGLRVTLQKLDPYLNVDPGTMNPYQHGEVYVTDDGAETDLDLGHYERFTGITTQKYNNVTTGQIYYSVITKERRGDYLGGTVQVVPHVTDEIKGSIKRLSRHGRYDLILCEVGGTVGDIEGLPFLEAIRQLRQELGRENALNIHLTLVPYIRAADELKTKPTQHSVGKLREIGIQPDILLCRTEKTISRKIREKIALFCNVDVEAVIQAKDVKDIYEVPLMFKEQGLDRVMMRLLGLQTKGSDLHSWQKEVVEPILHPTHLVRVAVVGKYIELQDAYKSVYEALRHGGLANRTRVIIKKVDAESIQRRGAEKYLKNVQGLLVPGGFGYRGIEGKIKAIRYARENKIPFLGLCLGMQVATIEFARSVCGLKGANSTEFDKNTPHPVISLLEEQEKVKEMGGTMRLGTSPCRIRRNTKTYHAYKKDLVRERHRHRYEFNNKYRKLFLQKGLLVTGVYPRKDLVEIVELKDHPWFVASQFHPEFRSRPESPHPLFREFIHATLENHLPQVSLPAGGAEEEEGISSK